MWDILAHLDWHCGCNFDRTSGVRLLQCRNELNLINFGGNLLGRIRPVSIIFTLRLGLSVGWNPAATFSISLLNNGAEKMKPIELRTVGRTFSCKFGSVFCYYKKYGIKLRKESSDSDFFTIATARYAFENLVTW